MRQVNFKELKVETSIDEFEVMDLRKNIGNAIHRQATTVPLSDISRKIYHSDGAVRMSDEDYSSMMTVVRSSFALLVVNAIERGTENVPVESGNDKKG